MDDDTLAVWCLLLLKKRQHLLGQKKKRQRRRRRYKVRPINRNRGTTGFFKSYFLRMKEIDPEQFFKYTRMDRELFEYLLALVKPLLQNEDRNEALSPEEQLCMTLHYLSQGSSMQTIAWLFHVGKTTVHFVLRRTCKAICAVLEAEVLKPPLTEQEWLRIADEFEQKWNFPHCLGALDGKHIQIRAPRKSGSLYYNYQKTFSIVLLGACDANYKFTVVDIGGYGSLSDGATLAESVFGQKLIRNDFHFPPRAPIRRCVRNDRFPYWFVADAAFPLSEHILRPYPGTLLAERYENFNKRLSRARRLIENTFGVLAARWRLLYQPINANVDFVELATKTCVCLHNYLCKPGRYCPPGYVDEGDEDNGQWRADLGAPLQGLHMRRPNSTHSLCSMRDALARYLYEEGRLV